MVYYVSLAPDIEIRSVDDIFKLHVTRAISSCRRGNTATLECTLPRAFADFIILRMRFERRVRCLSSHRGKRMWKMVQRVSRSKYKDSGQTSAISDQAINDVTILRNLQLNSIIFVQTNDRVWQEEFA